MQGVMSGMGRLVGSLGPLTVAALGLRLALIAYGHYQDGTMEVQYTDIDYHVFTDAARFVTEGESPYNRSTYRYTPLLAWILTPNIYFCGVFGKVLFVVCDVVSGMIIYRILRLQGLQPESASRFSSLWLLNPLPMGVSSRGNAESIMAVLVLSTLLCMEAGRRTSAAALYALSVHVKIYPLTYALPIALALHRPAPTAEDEEEGGGGRSWKTVSQFLRGFFNRELLAFAGVAGGVLFSLSALCYHTYGHQFLYQTYFYHLTRRDIRHNFSPYFYMFYLSADRGGSWFLGLAAFVPQLVLLLVSSWSFHRQLTFTCFLHTAIFVSFNKVCTSQYFLWYLCLLPLVLPHLRLSVNRGLFLVLLWFVGQGIWLSPAYFLEFKGFNSFLWIWLAGLLFLVINCFVLVELVVHYKPVQSSQRPKVE